MSSQRFSALRTGPAGGGQVGLRFAPQEETTVAWQTPTGVTAGVGRPADPGSPRSPGRARHDPMIRSSVHAASDSEWPGDSLGRPR